MHIIKRNGEMAVFDPEKIHHAVTMAFLYDADGAARPDSNSTSASVREKAAAITQNVVDTLEHRAHDGTVPIEDAQDQVELALMRAGEHKVARDYVLYRERRARERLSAKADATADRKAHIRVTNENGDVVPLDYDKMKTVIQQACQNWDWQVDSEPVLAATEKLLYDGITVNELLKAPILATRPLIEKNFRYSFVAARFLLDQIRLEAYGDVPQEDMEHLYADYFKGYIQKGIAIGRLDPRLHDFDLDVIGSALVAERDWIFQYQGLQILYDRYLIHDNERRIELPQAMWMRVAMGLALNETVDRDEWAIRFYQVLSTFKFVCSTPTLFNSGTTHPQLSSCFLTTVPDDLEGIFDAVKENALLSKFSGGLGNDWTPVRAMGSWIKGTNGQSQGVVPFLKVVNDTAVAVNQGGKRKGAVCAYLETWHMDIEEFLELRKNTGDDRRRTHDMNTANWIPDLFMERVESNAMWTLFSPNEAPDLHELTGKAFKTRYEQYEQMADEGKMTQFKRLPAVELWRKMLTMLFETGHPWITFKDPCNIRSPQRHAGVVHSSNLCTEITLNSSDSETAVCNLGSVNLLAHIISNPVVYTHGDEAVREEWSRSDLRTEITGKEALQHIDMNMLGDTVKTAMRMLDNVIDVNFYPTVKARNANLRHRAVGLGVMGFADALHKLRIPMDCNAAVVFADVAQEAISLFAIESSADLATLRGSYDSFHGSDWSHGILPVDTIRRLQDERGVDIAVDTHGAIHPDFWERVRNKVKTGMRNSNCMAIAPTATISNIVGVSQGIDPVYQNLYVKSNLSGEFTVIDNHLMDDLERLDLWDAVMVNDLKYFDGSVSVIDRVPQELQRLYATAFDVDAIWLIKMAAHRQKWVDQSISLNLYMASPSGKKIDDLYRHAWRMGLKTTYYLRTLGASSAEKSTITNDKLNAVSGIVNACAIDDPSCEACQ
ncbi:ribonucleoside-diphosphate reductase subunit alpha [Acidithiobacillus ferridurans]|uniref:Ribonucleoside-diphosphate reductase n=1 Tax=Acidithiobacillus ferridurans TaxID=1232575 RepID=A0A8X8K9H9_ACIFI|nr:ribonucleoside-diphosphate reductase subunit alpha [Acidithiobacillus ferridurans]MBU2715594.1 ribonucleoside-diphosphate reductase subunit alpha [Acidithiobacillus ferridurans]MBU2722916.1 ribonucleoside-diphosphate reductase subunit alpha [Acidithiobacillus ferridurans]MBU2728192.1 ribonucleoside-diphosphate reductase subunit alpha [Acidithiobacillus ferridurans]